MKTFRVATILVTLLLMTGCTTAQTIRETPSPTFSSAGKEAMPAYKHGRIAHMIEDWYDIPLSDNEYELLSDEEMDDYFKKLEETK